MDGYDIAQICLSGHVITSTAGSAPQFKQDRCKTCGDSTITNCVNCGKLIKGYYHVSGVDFRMHYNRPRFCENCGQAYPWITSQLEGINELIELIETLPHDQKDDLKECIQDLIKENSRVPVATVKLKRYLLKADEDISVGLKDMLNQILSDKIYNSL